MVDRLEFKQYNFKIINFSYLFKNLEKDLINDLHKYQLLESKISSNVRKLFYHHVILGVCESLLKDKTKEKSIVYFNENLFDYSFQILKYFKEEDLLPIVFNIIKKMRQLLPIKIFISGITFDYLIHLLNKNDGRSEELIANIRSYLNSLNHEKYTFSKILSFAKQNDLLFLSRDYFNQLKAKQLIIV